MKVAIIGTRYISYRYEDWLKMLMNVIDFDINTIDMVISGGAIGVDEYAQTFAQRHGLPILIFYPDYKKYRRTAPLIRNTQIVEAADLIIATTKPRSVGTVHAIEEAERLGKPVIRIRLS